MRSKSSSKLSLVVLLGTLGLGLSSVAKADLYVNWIVAYDKQDCPSTCGQTRSLKFSMPTGIDHNNGKPSFFICVTRKERGGEWRTGFNTWEQNTCTTAFGDEVYHGDRYYCLCTNNPRSKIFR
ncbi:MAG: hypothetical protein VSS75_020130 [Candidatus Parabeggiatoa sp.]|nr:hypothetical protein [Candidatus Parabeggiatoa sp.]